MLKKSMAWGDDSQITDHSSIPQSEILARADKIIPLLEGLTCIDIRILLRYTEWYVRNTAALDLRPVQESLHQEIARHAVDAVVVSTNDPLPESLQAVVDRVKMYHDPILRALESKDNEDNS